jgi:HEAT repeat protein
MRGYFTPESHLDTLLRDLDDRDEEMRSDAAYELGFLSDPEAVVGLRAALRDRSPAVRRLAAGALGRQGVESAIMPLFAALGDRSEEVRRESFDALALFGMSTLPPAILEIQRGASRRRAAPRLLLAASLAGRVGDDRAIEPLALLLTSRPVDARVAAARALGDLGLSGGIPALRDRLEDKQPEVRQAALRSIVLIAGPAARAVVEDYLRREADPGLKHLARTLLGSLQREPDRQEPATNSPRSADGEPANQIE